MPLSVSDKFGPYEILALIGAGGMGEVYRARDTRLAREVAIKILPDEFARDQDRMRRFAQEARAVAALNHPNVLSIFDTGVENGVPYLVSELLEGESLRQRLEQGPIPPRKAVEFARQIADGLAAAHEKSIVHRDLKPENLFVTNGGRVKILDFGLAKQSPDSNATAQAATATIATATNPGVVMGTAGYMAPEQVRGQAADHRADIFSFGAVLYEMLSGQRAFHRDTAVETLNAILKEEPAELDLNKLHVAPGLERIVHHCLEKKPAERFQSARDLTFALASLSDTSSELRAAVPADSSTRRIWIGVAAAILFAIGAAILTFFVMPRPEPQRLDFAIPMHGEVSHLAISQDGKWLAYVSPGDTGLPRIYVQRVGSTEVRALPGTDGASYPFWSPDSKYVAFFANYKMLKVAIAGGEPETIVPVGGAPRGGAWGSKGVIIYSRDAGGPLRRVNSDGSGEAMLTEKLFRPGLATHRFPTFLPDGDHFLMLAASFAAAKGQDSNTIILGSLSKPEGAVVVAATSSPGFGGGRMYYVDADGALVSAKLDVSKGKLAGPAKQIASHVANSPSTYYSAFGVSNDATVIYSADSTPSQSQLTWFDESGKELGRIGTPGVLANPSLSPDDKRVAFDIEDLKGNNIDVWILDLERGSSSRFTFDPTEETTPVWSRDGSLIAYRLSYPLAAVHIKKANGLEPDHPVAVLPDQADDIVPNDWSPGDREVLGTFQPGKGSYKLMLVPADGSKPRILFNSSGNQANGQFSPDGKWVAYASNESGNWEIYVTNYPGAAGKWQVSRGGGTEPRWSGDGKAIFYIAPGQMLTKVEVSTGDTFSAAVPKPLFQIHTRAAISSTDLFNYDVARDGKRFLVNQYIKPDQPPPLNIILHADASITR